MAKELGGMVQQTYARWENGDRKPNIFELAELALHFGVSTDWLLGLVDDQAAAIQTKPAPIDKDSIIDKLVSTVQSQQQLIAKMQRHNG